MAARWFPLVNALLTFTDHVARQCKARKIKCGEQKPLCINCEKTNQACDYSLKLNWEGRTKRKGGIENHMTPDNLRQTVQPAEQNAEQQLPFTIKEDQSYQQKIPPLQPSPSYDERLQHPLMHSPSFFNAIDPSQTLGYRPTINDTFAPAAQLARLQEENLSSYPSPTESNRERSPRPNPQAMPFNGFQPSLGAVDMPPPSQISVRHSSTGSSYADNGYKRARLSPSMKLPDLGVQHPLFMPNGIGNRANMNVPSTHRSPHSTSSQISGLSHTSIIPPSPTASSNESDESQQLIAKSSAFSQPDRRMSIESLITGSSYAGSTNESAFAGHLSGISNASTPKSSYGVDAGFPDLDIPKNDDRLALSGRVPASSPGQSSIFNRVSELSPNVRQTFSPEAARPFYRSPIEVKIPEEFEPLPTIMLNEPMNLLYFHHFISHTARILVPHDCSGNPFRKILPRSEHRRHFDNYLSDLCVSGPEG